MNIMDREKARKTIEEIDAVDRRLGDLKDEVVAHIREILDELPGKEYRVKGVPPLPEVPDPLSPLSCFLEDNCPYVEYRENDSLGKSIFGYVTRVYLDGTTAMVDGFELYAGEKAWLVGEVTFSERVSRLENPEEVLHYLLLWTEDAE